MNKNIRIIRPDDWHLHLRDGPMLRAVLPETTQHFARALVMPNLLPPIINSQDAKSYRDAIIQAIPDGAKFEPRMTFYLTEETDPDDLANAYNSGLIIAVKLYPAGVTTNSSWGVRNFEKVRTILDRMAEIGCPLCVHGEVTDPNVDIFDREAVFLDKILTPIITQTPGLRVVMEHITTKDAVDYVLAHNKYVAATITTHHLFINRNDILVGGIKPHYYCLPVAKREEHRVAICTAATGGDCRFFLGTDSAPHLDHHKETACGCAGCFTATNSMPLLAHIFEQENALSNLEGFSSRHGANFYGVPFNTGQLILEKKDTPVTFPKSLPTPQGEITVFDPGVKIYWQVKKMNET